MGPLATIILKVSPGLKVFHMACMILPGMGPVVERTTPNAKIFSSIYALYSGVAFLSSTAVFFAPIIHRLLHILHIEQDDNEHLHKEDKHNP